jgi:alpha-L-rhamnosidase
MNSFNHYAYGCVCQWLWQTAAGIQADPLQPGFRHFILAPQPDKRLGFVNAEYHSASGVIQSEWNYNDVICNWNFSIPEGTSATVIINGKKTEYTAGKWSLSIPEVLNEIETKPVCFKIMRDGILLIKTPNGLFNAIGQKYEH